MGNTNTPPSTKQPIPQKYLCPIAKKIMVNPIRMISSGNVYDKLSISKWIQSKRLYDPISATQFVTMLQEDCIELKKQIIAFLQENEHYNNNQWLLEEDLEWEALIKRCDKQIEQKAKYYEQLCNSLLTEAKWMIYPKKYGNPNDIDWNKDLLLLLLASTIPVITFIGASRQGKSTLLNDILGIYNNPPFTVSNSPDMAQTKGAWVALYRLSKSNDEKEEKKYEYDGRIKYDNLNLNSFFLVDMEGLTNQCTEFTEKTFYAIYAFSDIIVWNDKTFRSDHFENLMKKLKNTMSTLSKSPNKPSFLYLKRDKDNFYEFGKHKIFDEYIKNVESFKSFRELNLFSSINGYQIIQRPSNIIPFSTNTLQELMKVIFKGYKIGNRFIRNYSQLIQQYNYINAHGTLSLGTQFIMNDDILKWFIANDTNKMLVFADRNSFNEANIAQKFKTAIKDAKFQSLENNGIICKELKQELIDNRDILFHCMKNKRDTLSNFEQNAEAISQSVFGVLPDEIGMGIGFIGDVIVGNKYGGRDYTDEYGKFFADLRFSVTYPVAWAVSKLVTKTNEMRNKLIDKNYSRYQLLSTDGFDARKFLMQKRAIPLFVGSSSQEALSFDKNLLSLISCKEPIIVFVGSNVWLNNALQQNIFTKDSNPSIVYQLYSYLINMNTWNNSNDYIDMFCSLYCIADIIIWVDQDKTSESFQSFQKIISYSLQNAATSTIKPGFVYISFDVKNKQNQTIQKYFRNVIYLSVETEHLMQYIIEISQTQQRFCQNVVESDKIKRYMYECVSCSRNVNGGQCRNCGDLNLNVIHNNEYSFYRQLLYINKHHKLSLELQLIMQDPILKYFIFDKDDIYQERAMWQFAKKYKFNKESVEKTFTDKYCEFFRNNKTQFTTELMKGKELFIYALSSSNEEWISPFLSPLVTNDLDENVDYKEDVDSLQTFKRNEGIFVDFKEEEKQEIIANDKQHKYAIDKNEMSADREEFKKYFLSLRFGSETNKYYSKIVDLEYDDFDCMMSFTDEELQNDIKMKKLHQRKFKQKIIEFKRQYDEFIKWLEEEKMLRYLNKMMNVGCVTFEIFYTKFNKCEDILTVIGVENANDAKILWENSPKNKQKKLAAEGTADI